MCRINALFNSTFLYALFIFAIGLPASAKPLWADCGQNYPDSKVTDQLAKDQYKDCSLDAMAEDYAGFLRDKKRLLSALKPVYERKLTKKNLSGDELTARLSEYDNSLSDLERIKGSLLSWVTEISEDSEGNESEEISQDKKDTLSDQLEATKRTCDILHRRISRIKDELKEEEKPEFCKLDFFFRLSKGLRQKIALCLNE